MAKIKKVTGREILDSRGNPTVEVDVVLDNRILGTQYLSDRIKYCVPGTFRNFVPGTLSGTLSGTLTLNF